MKTKKYMNVVCDDYTYTIFIVEDHTNKIFIGSVVGENYCRYSFNKNLKVLKTQLKKELFVLLS